jgi:hypothetical protein
MTESFWTIPDVQNVRTPASILAEQAAALTEQTRGVLNGRVQTTSGSGAFAYDLTVIAPALGNYTFNVLQIQHGIALYPLTLKNYLLNTPMQLPDEAQFLAKLKEILSSEPMVRVIGGLLAQINAQPRRQ